MLCDEPTGALEAKTGIKVLEAIVAINQEFRTTASIIPDNTATRKIADRVIYLQDGIRMRSKDMIKHF